MMDINPYEIVGTTLVKYHEAYSNKENIVIPSRVTTIGRHAFAKNRKIKQVVIPPTVKKIEYSAFSGCTALEEVIIREGLEVIEMGAFSDCPQLAKISIPNTIECINHDFNENKNLIKSTYEGCFYLGNESTPCLIFCGVSDKSQREYSVHNDTRVILKNAFSGCHNMDNIDLPDNVIQMGYFSGCNVLTSISLGKNLRVLKMDFSDKSGHNIDTIIYRGTLNDWLKISFSPSFRLNRHYSLIIDGRLVNHLVIPEGVVELPEYCFYGCKSISSVSIPSSVVKIGNHCFSCCHNIKSFDVADKNSYYLGLEEGLIETATKKLIKGTTDTKTISDQVMHIGGYAFAYCNSIKAMTIAPSVEIVDGDAFACCENLQTVIFDTCRDQGNKVELYDWCFRDCKKLTKIEFPHSLQRICCEAFDGCSSLKNVEFPYGCQEFSFDAFESCELDSLILPTSIKKINIDCAFLRIGKLYYRGSKEQWEEIDYESDEYETDDVDLSEICNSIIFDYVDTMNDDGCIIEGKLACIEVEKIEFDCEQETYSMDLHVENKTNRKIRLWLKNYGIRTIDGKEETIEEYKEIDSIEAYQKEWTSVDIDDTEFNRYRLTPYHIDHPYDAQSCCETFFYTITVDFGENDIEECKSYYCAEDMLISGEYDLEEDEDDEDQEQEDTYIPDPNNFMPHDVLYIYKGNIRCHRYGHHIIQATAVLHNKTDNEIELNVEYCTECKKFILEYTIFEQYRNRYGVLVGNFRMVVNGEFDGEYDLAEESPLMLSGYNVSQRDGYTSRERHYILARIIHDGIMDKGDVIRYLSYFIRKNGAKRGNELALSKWEEDLAFVQDYDISTQPRAIISDIRRY